MIKSRRIKLAFTLWATFAFFTLASGAKSSPVTFYFAGELTSVFIIAPQLGTAAVGDTFSGSYTFDSLWVDSSNLLDQGSYSGSGGPYGFDVSVGGVEYHSDILTVNLGDGMSDGYYYHPSSTNSTTANVNGVNFGAMLLVMSLTSSDLWQGGSDDLPLSPPSISAFDSDKSFSMDFYEQLFGVRYSSFRGNITYLSNEPLASEVPIPAALPLFAAGLGAMGFMGWRRKQSVSNEKRF